MNTFTFTPDNTECTVEAYLQTSYKYEDMDNRLLPSIIVVPGGCYSFVADREAFPVVKEYYSAGYNVFVLNYSTGPKAKDFKPLKELLSTIAHIRNNQETFHSNSKIAVIGFSAGGHLACSSGTLFNKKEFLDAIHIEGNIRPDALILGYPVITADEYAHVESIENVSGAKKGTLKYNWFSLDKHVDKMTPPVFIWTTADDEIVPVENSLKLSLALSSNHIPYELHIFPHGPHGMSTCTMEVGSYDPYNRRWIDMSIKWLNRTLDFEG